MSSLLDPNADIHKETLKKVLASQNESFVPVLIELVRNNRVDSALVPNTAALEKLSGKSFGSTPKERMEWEPWVEWYGTTDIAPPPGFVGWKGYMLSKKDPKIIDLLTDQYPPAIRAEELQLAGTKVDAIPTLDNPQHVAASDADYMDDQEPVFGLVVNGEAMAYPLRIMTWHEAYNDVVGGEKIVVTYCPLSAAPIAYLSKADDGREYEFGTTGFEFRCNKMFFDRLTNSMWHQFTGKAVTGMLAAKQPRLPMIPVVVTTWKRWKELHPDTNVLSLNTGAVRDYWLGAVYADSYEKSKLMFPVWLRSDALPSMSFVYGMNLGEKQKAYSIEKLASERVVNDTLGGKPLVLIAAGDELVVDGKDKREDPVRFSVGAEIRVFERGDNNFKPTEDPDVVLEEQGKRWQVTENALVGPENQKLPRLVGKLGFWSTWYTFFPKTALYSK